MKHHRIAAVFLLVSGGLLASTIHEKIDRRVIGIEKIRSQISYHGAQKRPFHTAGESSTSISGIIF